MVILASMKTIAEVIARMRALDAALDLGDGVGWFNKMYLRTTEGVAAAWRAGAFEEASVLEQLDCIFADYFFKAKATWDADRDATPRAWAALFEARSSPRIAPLQFALCGMNAHINRDLAFALVDTWEAHGEAPSKGSPEHRDYLRINGILRTIEDDVKRWFSTGFIGKVDDALGNADDLAALWSIERARDSAWNHAEMLWFLRDSPGPRATYVETLDRVIGLAGRAMLLPRIG